MNDKLQDAITDLIKNSTDFVSGNAPEVVRELLAWEQRRLTIWISAELAFLAIFGFLVGWLWRTVVKDDALEEMGLCCVVATAIVVLIGIVLPACDVVSLMKVMTAPKVWLLEYAAALIPHGK